ncbi:MAG: AglZ/HisF2 family acetamidino modification protein [Bacteroidales bacterium]|nr:AglZ/HisF2 family acetamidino modification protein [Bacteroidales bacterium]
MYRPRVIPVLLLRNLGLVKSIKFKKYKYIGDPINAVKIFNDLEADELVFLDINASKEKRCIDLSFVEQVGSEANMPFGVGGGITNIKQIKQILNAGAEKIILNSGAAQSLDLIKDASLSFGSSTVSVAIDVFSSKFKKEKVYIHGGNKRTKWDPVTYAKKLEDSGAGEILINSINNDGMMNGYDIELIKKISKNVTIPVIACGGAGSLDDFRTALRDGYASAVAAGSYFVFHGPRRAVLINYPSKVELESLYKL